MYGRGNNAPQFRPTYPAHSPSPQPPFQHLHPPPHPSTMYSQPPPYPPRQPPLHMNTPPNYPINAPLPSFLPQSGNLNTQFGPPPAFPSTRVLPPFGVSTQEQFMYRNPHPPTTGMYRAHPPPPNFITPVYHDQANDAPLPSLPPDSPPPPPPPPSPPPSSSPLPESPAKEALEKGIVEDYKSDDEIILDRGNFEVEEVEAQCPSETEELPGQHSPPPPRPEEEVVQNIETFCKFMIDIGPHYENFILHKEAENPSFSFLHGGALGSADAVAHNYFNWMKRKHKLESDISNPGSSVQVSPPQPGNFTTDSKPTTPSESDMDMDADENLPEDRQNISKASKESVEEIENQPDAEEQISNVTEMPRAGFPTSSISSPLDQEIHDDSNVPDIHQTPAQNCSVITSPHTHHLGPVTSPARDVTAIQSVEVPPVCVKDGSPLVLIEDYASDKSEGDDKKNLRISVMLNQNEEMSQTYHHSDNDYDKDLRNDQHKESPLKVDEFGRMVKETASSSGSDEDTYYDRQHSRRGRSQSRSQSPQVKRRTRSPISWRERRSPSPSWSPRGRSRPWDHRRRGEGPPPECYNFRKGRCFRGASCWFSHHDLGHAKNRGISLDSRHMRREWNHRHERSWADVKDREALRDPSDLRPHSHFKGEASSQEGSFDSVKDGGKHNLPQEDVSRKEFDKLSGSEKVSDSPLMQDASQKSMIDSDNPGLLVPETRKSPDIKDHAIHDALTQPTTAPPEDSELPKTLPAQDVLHSQSETPVYQLPPKETVVDPTYSMPDTGHGFISHQKQDVGFNPSIPTPGLGHGTVQSHHLQTLQPPFKVNTSTFFSLSMPEFVPGYRPHFSFRADILARPPLPADGFSTGGYHFGPRVDHTQRPPSLGFPHGQPYGGNYFNNSNIPSQLNSSVHMRPEDSYHNNVFVDNLQGLRPPKERNPMNEFIQRPPPSGIPHGQPFEGNYFSSAGPSNSILLPEHSTITSLQNSAPHLRPEGSSHSNLAVDHVEVLQRPLGRPFDANFLTSIDHSKSTLPAELPSITSQGFHGSSAGIPHSFLPNKIPHLPDLGPPKLPLPVHYSQLPPSTSRYESGTYTSSFIHGASSSLILEPGKSKSEPPASDQYDPLFDSIDPPSRFDRSSADKIERNEFGETEAGAVENESPGSPVDFDGKGTGEVEVDQIRSPGKAKKSTDSKSMKLLKIALANFVKETLKPSWRQGNMSKEAYKTIVKKTVDKVSGSVTGRHLPRSQAKIDHYIESSRRKLTKLVMGYVDKYVKS